MKALCSALRELGLLVLGLAAVIGPFVAAWLYCDARGIGGR